MDTKGIDFSKRILDLRNEILESIKTILAEYNITKLDVSNAGNRTYVIWWDQLNYANEGTVTAVYYDGKEISLEIENYIPPVRVYEEDYALENPIWLNSVRDNILETLADDQNVVCHT